MNKDGPSFSKLMCDWRHARNLRQKEAAAHFGVAVRTYQQWEEGRFVPVPLARMEVERRMKIEPIKLDESY